MIKHTKIKKTSRKSTSLTICIKLIVIIAVFINIVLVGNAGIANADYVFSYKWGHWGYGNGEFNQPQGIASDSSKYVYVADTFNHRIQKFQLTNPCPSGTTQVVSGVCFVTKWGKHGAGVGEFNHTADVALDRSGNVFVVDYSNNRIQKFTNNGDFIRAWGMRGSGGSEFVDPGSIAVDRLGNVYVADTGNNRIQKFTNNGDFIRAWGQYGVGEGEFRRPIGIAVDSLGNVYVVDSGNHRIQKFGSAGTFIRTWGEPGLGNAQFSYALRVAVDVSGHVYVSENGIHRIQKFTSTGTFIAKWGKVGVGDGEFRSPSGIAVYSGNNVLNERVYIVDFANNRIQAFAWKLGANP